MKLTKLQLKILKFYAKYQTERLTLFKIAGAFWLSWLWLLGVLALGWFYVWGGWRAFGWVIIGIAIGAFLRDVNRILTLFRTWPALHEVFNWDRLKDLIQPKEQHDPKSSTEPN